MAGFLNLTKRNPPSALIGTNWRGEQNVFVVDGAIPVNQKQILKRLATVLLDPNTLNQISLALNAALTKYEQQNQKQRFQCDIKKLLNLL